MLQFNLLPDVKLQYVKTQRTNRLLTLISLLVVAGSLVVLVLAYTTVHVVQKKSINDENKDIAHYSSQLKNTSDLNKILTVQSQLGTLTSLHDQKPVVDRLFAYVQQVTPAQASLNELQIDFTTNTLTLGGSAPSLDVVSTYTDTLKAANYKVDGVDGSKRAFSAVVLGTFGRDTGGASFTITLNFDPIIFNTANKVSLNVPQSVRVDQSDIFGGNN